MTWFRSRTFAAVVLYLVLALVTQFGVQQYGEGYLDDSLIKATASFAVARGLNGIITVFQESSISAGVVVGGSVAVGQVLDPVNDLIEYFSWVMLLSIVSLGVQKLLLVIGVRAGIALFVLALGVFLVRWGLSRRTGRLSMRPVERLLLLAIVVQAAVPLSSSLGRVVSETFLAERYAQAEGAITQVQSELQSEYGAPLEGEERRWFDRLDPRRFVQTVAARASEVTTHVIDLIIIFVFETLVMPLLTFLLLLYLLGAFVFRLDPVDREPSPPALLKSEARLE